MNDQTLKQALLNLPQNAQEVIVDARLGLAMAKLMDRRYTANKE
jgi:hypothetical protein